MRRLLACLFALAAAPRAAFAAIESAAAGGRSAASAPFLALSAQTQADIAERIGDLAGSLAELPSFADVVSNGNRRHPQAFDVAAAAKFVQDSYAVLKDVAGDPDAAPKDILAARVIMGVEFDPYGNGMRVGDALRKMGGGTRRGQLAAGALLAISEPLQGGGMGMRRALEAVVTEFAPDAKLPFEGLDSSLGRLFDAKWAPKEEPAELDMDPLAHGHSPDRLLGLGPHAQLRARQDPPLSRSVTIGLDPEVFRQNGAGPLMMAVVSLHQDHPPDAIASARLAADYLALMPDLATRWEEFALRNAIEERLKPALQGRRQAATAWLSWRDRISLILPLYDALAAARPDLLVENSWRLAALLWLALPREAPLWDARDMGVIRPAAALLRRLAREETLFISPWALATIHRGAWERRLTLGKVDAAFARRGGRDATADERLTLREASREAAEAFRRTTARSALESIAVRGGAGWIPLRGLEPLFRTLRRTWPEFDRLAGE